MIYIFVLIIRSLIIIGSTIKIKSEGRYLVWTEEILIQKIYKELKTIEKCLINKIWMIEQGILRKTRWIRGR